MNSRAGNLADLAEIEYYRNSDVRYGANCPGIVELTFKDRKHFIALTGVIVNLSVTGCLFSNDQMPWANMDARISTESIFNVVEKACRIYIPWTNTQTVGKIRRIKSYIIGVQFHKPLDVSLVKSIASLEPNRNLRFRPRIIEKYNRILPLTDR